MRQYSENWKDKLAVEGKTLREEIGTRHRIGLGKERRGWDQA